MSRTSTRRAGAGIAGRAYRVITALWMAAGHGPRVRAVADAAELTGADRVVDVGCGPGTAVRFAAARAATATGIDTDPAMLRFAHWSTAIPRPANISWLEGRAEKLPLPDGQATVVWAISSAHHRGRSHRRDQPGPAGARPGRPPGARRAPGQASGARARRPRSDSRPGPGPAPPADCCGLRPGTPARRHG